jgi:hypothetical protein
LGFLYQCNVVSIRSNIVWPLCININLVWRCLLQCNKWWESFIVKVLRTQIVLFETHYDVSLTSRESDVSFINCFLSINISQISAIVKFESQATLIKECSCLTIWLLLYLEYLICIVSDVRWEVYCSLICICWCKVIIESGIRRRPCILHLLVHSILEIGCNNIRVFGSELPFHISSINRFSK